MKRTNVFFLSQVFTCLCCCAGLTLGFPKSAQSAPAFGSFDEFESAKTDQLSTGSVEAEADLETTPTSIHEKDDSIPVESRESENDGEFESPATESREDSSDAAGTEEHADASESSSEESNQNECDEIHARVRHLEVLRGVHSLLDTIAPPNPPDSKVALSDASRLLESCRNTPQPACTPEVVAALAWLVASGGEVPNHGYPFSDLDVAVDSNGRDGLYSREDIDRLIWQLLAQESICRRGDQVGRKDCLFCTYDQAEELRCSARAISPLGSRGESAPPRENLRAACEGSSSCLWIPNFNGGVCAFKGRVQCEDEQANFKAVYGNDAPTEITTIESVMSTQGSLFPASFAECRTLRDVHFGHSTQHFLGTYFATRYLRAHITAPGLREYAHRNWGCLTFGSATSWMPDVQNKQALLESLLVSLGFPGDTARRLYVTGNQDYSAMLLAVRNFSFFTPIGVRLSLDKNGLKSQRELTPCLVFRGNSCRGFNRVIMCEEGGRPAYLRCEDTINRDWSWLNPAGGEDIGDAIGRWNDFNVR